MRQSPTADPAVQELQDEARATGGRRMAPRWRTIEGTDEDLPALLFQWFTAGGTWKTVWALRNDGTTRQVA